MDEAVGGQPRRPHRDVGGLGAENDACLLNLLAGSSGCFVSLGFVRQKPSSATRKKSYARGNRSAFWLVRQILSAVRSPQPQVAFNERRTEMLSNFWSDLRYTLRTFRRNPGFAVAALVPIALGIGINTGVFSILNNVAFRSLPVPDPTELVNVYQEFQGVKKRRVHGARIMFSHARVP